MISKQKESAKPLNKQLLVLGIGGGALLIVLMYQTFFNAPSFDQPSVSANSEAKGRFKAADLGKQPQAGQNAVQPAQPQNSGYEQSSLDLDAASWGRSGDGDSARNIFAYPPPPPPPPPPPAKEVTVPISSISPNNVYSRTPKEIELVVRGTNFTPEIRIYLNGTPTFGQTKFVSATELRAVVPRSYFTTAQQLRVEVKQPGREEEFFSNPISLNIIESPKPRFNLLGRVSDGNDQNPQAILIEEDRQITVSVGQEFGEGKNNFGKPYKWKAVEIGPASIKVVDISTAVGVDHSVPMKDLPDKASSGAISAFASGAPTTENTPAIPMTYMGEAPVAQTSVEQQPAQNSQQQKAEDQQKPTYVGRQGNQSDAGQFFKGRQEDIMRRRQEALKLQQQQQNPQQQNPINNNPSPYTPRYGGGRRN